MNNKLFGASLLTIILLLSISPLFSITPVHARTSDTSSGSVTDNFWNTVNGIKDWFWNTFIEPAIRTISDTVKTGISDVTNALFGGLKDAFSTLFNMVTAPFKQIATAWGNLYTDTKNALPSWAAPFTPLLITGIAAGGIVVIVYIAKWLIPGI